MTAYCRCIYHKTSSIPSTESIGLRLGRWSAHEEWEDQLIDTMRRYANELECSHLEGYGRKAWGRALKKYGFYPEYIAYRMEL
jgi:hypothetical protein